MSEDSQLNMANGFTVAVYFPPEAPGDEVARFIERLALTVHGELFPGRRGWDPFVFAQAGDTCRMATDEHIYLSTACFHGDHEYCQSNTGLCGQKVPATCKFCRAPCTCACHKEGQTEDH